MLALLVILEESCPICPWGILSPPASAFEVHMQAQT